MAPANRNPCEANFQVGGRSGSTKSIAWSIASNVTGSSLLRRGGIMKTERLPRRPGPITKSEILAWVLQYFLVSIFLLALLLKVISPELDYLYENADRAAMRSIEFAIWTLPLLVIFWATYRRIRFEKRRRGILSTKSES